MARVAGQPVHLVGHSLGALVALHHASQHPETVAGLTLIEPVIVGILYNDLAGGDVAAGRSLDEIGAMIAAFRAAMALENSAAAMRAFSEYWEGPGAWDAIPAAARLPFFARAAKMAADVDLAWADRTGRDALAALGCPAQVLSAERTTPAARDMAQRIADALPNAAFAAIADAGHMAPVSHPAAVASLLLEFGEGALEGFGARWLERIFGALVHAGKGEQMIDEGAPAALRVGEQAAIFRRGEHDDCRLAAPQHLLRRTGERSVHHGAESVSGVSEAPHGSVSFWLASSIGRYRKSNRTSRRLASVA